MTAAPARMIETSVTTLVAEATDASAWDRYLAEHPDASGYHLWAWREVFTTVFGHEVIYLQASRDGRIAGVLPLVSFRSRLFGRFAVSLPFLNYGGVVADDEEVATALLEAAATAARERGASHLELRHTGRRFPQLPAKAHKVAMVLALNGTAETIWDGLDRKVRNQVRKAEKSGLSASLAGADGVDAFYDVFAANMRDLGTPVYPKRLFDTVLRLFPDRARLVLVHHDSQVVAGGLMWRWRDTVEVPWASSLRSFNSMAPNNLLYWTIIKEAVGDGAHSLDFGRSTPNEGTFHFKRQWGAEPRPLHWEYALVEGQLPDQSPKNPKFERAIAAWQRLPLWLTNRLGPRIVRSIP